jgi:dTDP-glucose 4,6-dehydratase
MTTFDNQLVLVTGADGFIGSHLAETLVQAGARVRALTLYNSFGSWGWLDGSASARDMEIVSGDIRDAALMREVTHGVDLVFHLAALGSVPHSVEKPLEYHEVDATGTVRVIKAAHEAALKKSGHDEQKRMVLEAHEALVQADSSNEVKFKDVLEFMRHELNVSDTGKATDR